MGPQLNELIRLDHYCKTESYETIPAAHHEVRDEEGQRRTGVTYCITMVRSRLENDRGQSLRWVSPGRKSRPALERGSYMKEDIVDRGLYGGVWNVRNLWSLRTAISWGKRWCQSLFRSLLCRLVFTVMSGFLPVYFQTSYLWVSGYYFFHTPSIHCSYSLCVCYTLNNIIIIVLPCSLSLLHLS